VAQIYKDRVEGGAAVAREVLKLGLHDPLVLAIPRGGVVTGAEVARALGVPLDIVVARKLGAPGEPELAIGAVMHDGSLYLNEEIVSSLRVSQAYIEEEKKRQMAEAARRLRVYRGDRAYPRVAGRDVLIVDDGVATGATVMAAARWARSQGGKRVVIAAPVAPRETVATLRREVDETVFCSVPEPFYAIGQFYEEFDQVSDDEVISILRQSWSGRP
jgi:putative phosphoribosyl transferase